MRLFLVGGDIDIIKWYYFFYLWWFFVLILFSHFCGYLLSSCRCLFPWPGCCHDVLALVGKLTRKVEYKLRQSGHLISSHPRSKPQTESSAWWIICVIRLKFLHFTTAEIFVFTEDCRCYFLTNSSFFFPANCKHFWDQIINN